MVPYAVFGWPPGNLRPQIAKNNPTKNPSNIKKCPYMMIHLARHSTENFKQVCTTSLNLKEHSEWLPNPKSLQRLK